MKELTIYLGDLTHDTVGLATEVFPLNIGYVAAYVLAKHHAQIKEVRLFKYIPQLEEAILKNPPDVIALSNYPWCLEADLVIFELLRKIRSESLCIMGGPNFPHAIDSQLRFLKERPLIDLYVYMEGETGFANLIGAMKDVSTLEEARQKFSEVPIEGCLHRNLLERKIQPAAPRIVELDQVPSPYLTHLLDPFFDGRLSPMIMTNRGCPFRCTFCADGDMTMNRINNFSLERAKAEIRYIAERVPKNIHHLFLCDLNFGMYVRDTEISEAIAEVQREFGYPRYVTSTTGKNAKERVISAIEKLNGTLHLSMSVQSLTETVLKNIKRDNIKVEHFLALKPTLIRLQIPTHSEVILGLPGETLESHFQSFGQLLDADIDLVIPYTLMMLNGTELTEKASRDRFGIKTKFRILPRDFTKLKSGRTIVEVEEVAVATNTLSFEDYLTARQMALLVMGVNSPGFRVLIRFFIEKKIQVMELLIPMLRKLRGEPDANMPQTPPSQELEKLFNQFSKETIEELWDSPEEIHAFFSDHGNFKKLVEGEYGKNILQTYQGNLFANGYEPLHLLTFEHAEYLLKNKEMCKTDWEIFEDIREYCRGRGYNLFGKDRCRTDFEVLVKHDLEAWLLDPERRSLSYYKKPKSKSGVFYLTEEQFKTVEDALDLFGHNALGRSKVMTRVEPQSIWRKFKLVDSAETELPSALAG